MIDNFYEKIKKPPKDKKLPNPNYGKTHWIKLPFRAIIAGPSGSGKTNCALNIIKRLNGCFTDLTVICKNEQPLYNYLKERDPENVNIIIMETIADIPPLTSFDKSSQHLVVFDDVVMEKNQQIFKEYFLRGRHSNVSIMYLSQSYYATPIFIRQNASWLIIKKLTSVNDLKRILKENSLDVNLQELTDIYKECTRNKMDWMAINLEDSTFYHNFEKLDVKEEHGSGFYEYPPPIPLSIPLPPKHSMYSKDGRLHTQDVIY